MEDRIAKYRGNYIGEMRKTIGHAPLIVVSCGVIIENDRGEILLQKRQDNGCWAILGGSMEIGEKVEEAARREVWEEAALQLGALRLFGVYSGEDRLIVYPNGDICYGACIVFETKEYSGEVQNQPDEAIEHRFFGKDQLPAPINAYDKQIIEDWAKNPEQVIVD